VPFTFSRFHAMLQTSAAGSGLLVLVMMACAGAKPALDSDQVAVSARCELPEATVSRREGNSVLQAWELPMSPLCTWDQTLDDPPAPG